MPKISPAHEQHRRTQILAAAHACFARQGYRATSMDDVVRESGLSVGAIYTYFPSKEDLFLALAEQRSHDILAAMNDLFRRPGPMADKFQQAIDYFFGLLSEDLAPLARMNMEFWSEAIKSDRVRERELSRCHMVSQFYRWLIATAKVEGAVRSEIEVEPAAELLMALNEGLVLLSALGVRRVPLDALKAAYTSFIDHGLADPAGQLLDAQPLTAAAANGQTPRIGAQS